VDLGTHIFLGPWGLAYGCIIGFIAMIIGGLFTDHIVRVFNNIDVEYQIDHSGFHVA